MAVFSSIENTAACCDNHILTLKLNTLRTPFERFSTEGMAPRFAAIFSNQEALGRMKKLVGGR
jgi:hypothetical protein